MTFYFASPNFNVLNVIINFLLAKNQCKNILKRTIWGYEVSRQALREPTNLSPPPPPPPTPGLTAMPIIHTRDWPSLWQGCYVFGNVHLFLCHQHYSKSCERIAMKVYGGVMVRGGNRNKWLNVIYHVMMTYYPVTLMLLSLLGAWWTIIRRDNWG